VVRVWDLASGAPVGDPFTGHTDWVRAVAVGELDGRAVVVSAGDDGVVRVWDLASGAPVGDPFTGHTGPVYAVAVGELDGRAVVVSAGDDGVVRVWDLAAELPGEESQPRLAIELASEVNAEAIRGSVFVAATDLGLVAIDLAY